MDLLAISVKHWLKDGVSMKCVTFIFADSWHCIVSMHVLLVCASFALRIILM